MNQIVLAIAESLRGALGEITVTEEFPQRARELPMKRGMVTVGLRDAEILPCAVSDFVGLDAQGRSLYAKSLEVTVAMGIFTRPPQTAAECQRVFGLICGALLFGEQAYDIGRVWCGEVRYDKESGALTLPCFARAALRLCRTEDAAGLAGFEIKKTEGMTR